MSTHPCIAALPCPFCGRPPEIFASGDGSGEMVECITAGCVNPHVSYYGKNTARIAWNRRLPFVELPPGKYATMTGVATQYDGAAPGQQIVVAAKERPFLETFLALAGLQYDTAVFQEVVIYAKKKEGSA